MSARRSAQRNSSADDTDDAARRDKGKDKDKGRDKADGNNARKGNSKDSYPIHSPSSSPRPQRHGALRFSDCRELIASVQI